MADKFAATLLAVIVCGVLTAWVPEPWAVDTLYAAVFALGAIWLFHAAWRGAQLRTDILLLAPIAAALWGVVQLLSGWTVNRWATMNAVLLWSASAVLFFLALQLFVDAARRERFLRRLLWFITALALGAVLQHYTASKIFWYFDAPAEGFMMGPFPHHNHFCALLLLLLPVALDGAVRIRGRLLADGLMAAALVGAIVASASRSGAALAALEVAFVLVIALRKPQAGWLRREAPKLALIAVLIVGGAAAAGWDSLWNRSQHGDPVRLAFARSTVAMIRSHPLRGFGLGSWPSVYPMYATFDDGLYANQAHSDWLQWAAEGGLPFAAMLAVFAGVLTPRAVRSAWGLGVAAVLVLALVDYPLQKPTIVAVFSVMAGVVAVGCTQGSRAISANRDAPDRPASETAAGRHSRG